jgi:hypothetical protein
VISLDLGERHVGLWQHLADISIGERVGASVALTYANSAEKAAETARAAEAHGQPVIAIKAASADPKAVVDAVAQTIARFGHLEWLEFAIDFPYGHNCCRDHLALMELPFYCALRNANKLFTSTPSSDQVDNRAQPGGYMPTSGINVVRGDDVELETGRRKLRTC